MGDVPTEEVPSEGPALYDTGGLSAGGQVYTNTEIGKYIYGGEARGVGTSEKTFSRIFHDVACLWLYS